MPGQRCAIIAGVIIAYAISGCCGDDPDLCGQGELIVDAGLAPDPCWTAERAPLRTEATVAEPGLHGILGCVQLDGGWCVQGAAGEDVFGARARRHHAPAGAWVTTARGFGCPGAECAMEVGRAQAHIGPRAAGVVNRPAPIEYDLRCDPPPGRPPVPDLREPRTGDLRPAWMVECLDGLPLWTEPMGNGRWRIHDVEAQQNVIERGRVRGWTGVERASVVAHFMGCTQRRCAALNTWSEPARDLDRDGVQARCDVCPAMPDPGQPDQDGDRVGDVCDLCPAAFDPWQTDQDGDGLGDVCDVCPAVADDQRDSDGDGFGDACDVCPTRFDPAQRDGDGDGFGDVCDVCRDVADVDQRDGDGDGFGDACDNCPALADVMQVDTDADGAGDVCDEDDDGDGLSDEEEAEAETDPLNPDTDDDGVEDGEDNCPLDPNPGQEETDDPSNGAGDACDLPLPPIEDHPDAPPTGDQIVWIDAVRVDPPRSVARALLEHATGLVSAAAATYYDAWVNIADPPDQPPVVDPPDQPPVARRRWHWVQEVVERLAGELEDATGQTVGIILGRAYEQWAGTTYCHSNTHALAFAETGRDPEEACQREFIIPRTTLDFDNPQPLIDTMRRRLSNGEVREYRFERKRRHDCHCEGVPGLIAPLSEEYKASRAVRRAYRARYRRWLVQQCKDYRFTLARLTQEAMPHLGSVREVYQRLNRSMRLGRPSLLYRLLRETGAMRQVLEECRFAEIADDTGVMAEAEVVARRRARPEEPTSTMQSRVSAPGWRSPPDAVQGCEGGLIQHYLAKGCPVAPGVQAPPGLGICAPEARRWGVYTRCAAEGEVDIDPFVNPLRTNFDTGYGSPSLVVIDTPVCPPQWISVQSALIWEEMAGVDRLRNRLDPEGFQDFFERFQSLHWWGFPIWIGTSDGGDIVQAVQRGQWVITHEDIYMDRGEERMGPNGEPLSPVDTPPPIWDGVVGIPELEVDPDEARDACFD